MDPNQSAAADILIVEDDETTTEVLDQVLGDQGWKVATARDGQAGIHFLQQQQERGQLPCVILLDLVMPVDGWRFREQQLEDPVLATIPVILMSGVYQPGPAAQSLQAVAYLPQPIDLELLVGLVRGFCRP